MRDFFLLVAMSLLPRPRGGLRSPSDSGAQDRLAPAVVATAAPRSAFDRRQRLHVQAAQRPKGLALTAHTPQDAVGVRCKATRAACTACQARAAAALAPGQLQGTQGTGRASGPARREAPCRLRVWFCIQGGARRMRGRGGCEHAAGSPPGLERERSRRGARACETRAGVGGPRTSKDCAKRLARTSAAAAKPRPHTRCVERAACGYTQ